MRKQINLESSKRGPSLDPLFLLTELLFTRPTFPRVFFHEVYLVLAFRHPLPLLFQPRFNIQHPTLVNISVTLTRSKVVTPFVTHGIACAVRNRESFTSSRETLLP